MSERPPMQTECPGCGTVFRVTEHQLRAAGGECRCGLCGRIFDARPAGYRQAPSPEEPTAPSEGEASRAESGAQAPAASEENAEAATTEAGWEEPARWPDDERVEAPPVFAPAAEEPDFTVPAARSARRRWPWVVLAVLLVIALAAQLAWFNRETLLADPRLRELAVAVCSGLGCEVGVPSRPDRVAVIERTLRAAPQAPERLEFSARVVNRHTTPIAWPELGLRLRALNGTVVAERWFTPSEYLPSPPEGVGMPVDEPVSVTVTLADPQRRAEGFEVEFR